MSQDIRDREAEIDPLLGQRAELLQEVRLGGQGARGRSGDGPVESPQPCSFASDSSLFIAQRSSTTLSPTLGSFESSPKPPRLRSITLSPRRACRSLARTFKSRHQALPYRTIGLLPQIHPSPSLQLPGLDFRGGASLPHQEEEPKVIPGGHL
ncbi:hypothetical protein FSST1_006209 [Fusarium sambucinum]